MSSDACVSVIVPHSLEHTPVRMLRKAVESVEAQSFPTNIFIITTISKFDASAIGEDHNSDVTLINDSEHSGPSWARNRGIEEATCRYVDFLDADDIWQPDKLQRQMNELRKTGAGMCIEGSNLDSESLIEMLLLNNISSKTSSILIDTQKTNAKFNVEMKRYEDHLFLLQVAAETDVCSCEDIVVSRKHSEGLSATGSAELNIAHREEFRQRALNVVDVSDNLKRRSTSRFEFRNGRSWYYESHYCKAICCYVRSLKSGFYWKTPPAFILAILGYIVARIRNLWA